MLTSYLGPSSLQSFIPRDSTLLKFKDEILVFCLASSSHDHEVHHIEGRQACLTLKLPTPVSSSLFHDVEQSYPLSLGSGSCQSALSSNLLGCSCPAVLPLQETSGCLRSYYKDYGLWMWGYFQLFKSISSTCSSWSGGLQQTLTTMATIWHNPNIRVHKSSTGTSPIPRQCALDIPAVLSHNF